MPEQSIWSRIWRIPLVDKRSKLSRIILALSLATAFAAGIVLLSACTANSASAPQGSPTALGEAPQGSTEDRTLRKTAAGETADSLAPAATPQPSTFGSASPVPSAANPNESANAQVTNSPVAQGSFGIPAPVRRLQKNEGGSVTIEVKWVADQLTGGSLPFAVTMDTHSVDLDKLDLSKLAILRNDNGQEVTPTGWDAPTGGHHRSGTLKFPVTVDGEPLLDASTKYLELVIRDVAGVKERVIRWDLEVKS